MSCICQYFVHSNNPSISATTNSECVNSQKHSFPESPVDNTGEEYSIKSDVSATDIATARAEIWVLKKTAAENRVSIENLENLVKTIMDKQNVMLTEMYRLKRINFELREESRMQRDYHTMERNAMIRELHDVKALLSNRSKLLEETIQKNTELMNSVQDATEKIYLMGMKYLKIKNLRNQQLTRNSDSEHSLKSGHSEESENSEQSD